MLRMLARLLGFLELDACRLLPSLMYTIHIACVSLVCRLHAALIATCWRQGVIRSCRGCMECRMAGVARKQTSRIGRKLIFELICIYIAGAGRGYKQENRQWALKKREKGDVFD